MKLDWNDTEQLSRNIASQVKASGFKPDMILGVARGGLIPAVIIASILGTKDVISISIRSYTKDRKRKSKPEYLHSLPEKLIKGQQILIVDDIVDSGNTFKSLEKQLTPDSLAMFSAMLVKDTADFDVHFKGHVITKPDIWTEFPWEANK